MHAAAARQSTRGRRRRRSLPLHALLLLLLPLALSPTLARGEQPGDEQRGPLTAEGLDALVERFVGLVARAAALGGGGEADGGADSANSAANADVPAPGPPLLLDPPTIRDLLSRLLDEVLPDSAPEALRARTAEAMGVGGVAPAPPPRPEAAAATTATDEQPAGNRRRRRALLQNATPLSPLVPPASALTVDRGGRLGGWAQSFQLAFSNVFDFFLRGGYGWLVPVIGDTLAPLRRYNWVRDLGMAIDAPFDNVVNANYFPLPQTTGDLRALALRLLAPWCAPEEATAGDQVLGAVRGLVAELELVPWSCDVLPAGAADADASDSQGDDVGETSAGDEDEVWGLLFRGGAGGEERQRGGGASPSPAFENKINHKEGERRLPRRQRRPRQRFAWETCTPSKLVLRLKPAALNGPYFSSASYTGAACAFTQPFGVASSFTLGLDAAAIALKLSRIGVDVTPTIVQFESSARFFPWLSRAIANNGTIGPPREVAFTSAANTTTGGGR